MPALKGEAYHWELLNREEELKKKEREREREIERRICGLPLGCLWISSDFIRKKMAEAIPPDNSQLACVGEPRCPKKKRKRKKKISEKRKWKNHAVPLQFILCIRLTPKQSPSSPAARLFCGITRSAAGGRRLYSLMKPMQLWRYVWQFFCGLLGRFNMSTCVSDWQFELHLSDL